MKCTCLVTLAAFLAPTAAKVYTGFNYGAFWSEQSNVKRYADFHHGFELAKNLTGTPVPFDSARLYTCITTGTKDDPTEAFQAAIDTGTSLLLGMWVSPSATGQPNHVQVENELAALTKAFKQHGQKLADLVIGLSVGSEDVHRFNNAQAGLANDDLFLTVKSIREKITASPYAKYMEGKPIGHTDTAQYSVVLGNDFVGMDAYPYWEGQSIANANVTFMSLLKDTQRRAGNTSVWISEMGWPINGTEIKEAVASAENYQRYWTEVGCQVFGKYNTFWFELLQDSQPDQPDWGLLDTKTYQPRIRELGCGYRSNATMGASNTSLSKPQPTTFSTVYLSTSPPITPLSAGLSEKPTIMSTQSTRTTRTIQTRTITVLPTSLASADSEGLLTLYLTTTAYEAATPTSSSSSNGNSSCMNGDDNITVCIVMIDLMGDGVFIPVATYASDVSTCSPPPKFTGSPFTMIVGPTTTLAASSGQRSSFDLYAPSTAVLPSPTTALILTTTAVNANGPLCMTSAGVAYEAVISNGQTYYGKPTSCFSDSSAVPTLDGASSFMRTSSSSTALSISLVTSPIQPSLNLVSSLLSSVTPLSTFLTVITTAPTSLPVPTPAAPQPTVAASSSPPPISSPTPPSSITSMTFSVTVTQPPVPTPSIAKSFYIEGATVCTTPKDQGYIAKVVNGFPKILSPLTGCSSTPAPPPNAAAPTLAALPILSQALGELKKTTWAAPIPAPTVLSASVPTIVASISSSNTVVPPLPLPTFHPPPSSPPAPPTWTHYSPGPAVPRDATLEGPVSLPL